eukprot:TRINITY_DN31122_c0_g1_i1.p1 TRINITY_DN31122_c0_g1~~TRINITY_DN31122_c0_g1_i1.p1  ORF type:complete len:365 (+),score=64.59 TRINITY_DN31122_c0_g1_i1:90-1184(+)
MAAFSYASHATSDVPIDGEMVGRQRQTSSELQSRAAGDRATYEMTMRAFGCPHDVDAGCGCRLQQAADKASFSDSCGVASVDIARRCGGLSERRLRGEPVTAGGPFGSPTLSMLAVNSGLEALDIDACCRRRRLSPTSAREDDGALQGRAFFDHIYHAKRYAELLGRPVISSRRPDQSLLKTHLDLPMWCEGDEDDVSTSAFEEQCHEPSPEVRQVLKALLPSSGEIAIPMKMVARLETLVGLAERVDSGRRLLDHLDCSYMPTSPSSPQENSQVQPEASVSESLYPTLLKVAPSGGGKSAEKFIACAGKLGNELHSEVQFSEASTVPPESSQSSIRDQFAAQRRAAFNVVVQGGGRAAWKMIQ